MAKHKQHAAAGKLPLSEGGTKRRKTAQSLANTKLREDYRSFSDEQTDVLVDPVSGKTLRKILEEDCQTFLAGQTNIFTQAYHEANRRKFQVADGVFESLKPPLESPSASPTAMKVTTKTLLVMKSCSIMI